jgi:hypothetical protein
MVYAGLGRQDQAFAWLERAYQTGDFGLVSLKAEPYLISLREDPRFQHLLRRINFPP